MTPDARAVALAYMKAFETKDKDEARSYLHAEGLFTGPMRSFQDAEAFVKEMSTFMQLTKKVRIKKILYDNSDVCILWDYETTIPSIPVIPIAEWFRIENGKIREKHLHFNPMPILAAVQRGEIPQVAEALDPRRRSD